MLGNNRRAYKFEYKKLKVKDDKYVTTVSIYLISRLMYFTIDCHMNMEIFKPRLIVL